MTFGVINEHIVGTLLLDWVSRAVRMIKNQRFVFDIRLKENERGELTELVTSVDNAVQDMYLDCIHRCFPGVGILTEEQPGSVYPKDYASSLYFTIDPLDGTRAFIRRQSHGIGTLISLVMNGEIQAAYVGDVMAGDIYGYRPGGQRVWRYSEQGVREALEFAAIDLLNDQYILLREPVSLAPAHVQSLLRPVAQGGIFSGQTIDSGSIGTWLARLWKGEFAAALLPPTTETPWDNTPLIGICKKMGFVLLHCQDDGTMTEENYTVPTASFRREHYQLLIHRRDKDEFLKLVEERASIRY
jgi:fructose-1,6-bisphosphatase/inositol monophosphatase family enzyme